MDVYAMEPGLDFVEVIDEHIGKCSVLLVVIGRAWLGLTEEGTRRIDNAGDFHRLEIEAALTRGIRVIPVLVQGAAMPREEELPDGLKRFARRHALEITATRWDYDVGQLFEVVERILKRDRAAVAPPKRVTELDLESGVVEAALHAIDTVGVERLRQQQQEKQKQAEAAPPVEAAPRDVVARSEDPPEGVSETESRTGVGWKVAVGLAVVGVALAVALWPDTGLRVAGPPSLSTSLDGAPGRIADPEPATAVQTPTIVPDATPVEPATTPSEDEVPLTERDDDASVELVSDEETPDAPQSAVEPEPVSAPTEPNAARTDDDDATDAVRERQADLPEPPTQTIEEREVDAAPVSPPTPPAPEPSGLRGTFRDSSGGVAALTVRLVGQNSEGTLETTTAEDGAFQFFPVPPGAYTVLFIRDQETVYERPGVSIREGQFRSLTVDSQPAEPPR
jgi:hypothetical protein